MSVVSSLVLLHGFWGDGQSFGSVCQQLGADPRRIIVPPISGHGRAMPRGWSFQEEAARLAAEVRAQVPGDYVLCGYSMGARLALGVAILDWRSIRRLVLLSGRRGLQPGPEREQRRLMDERWARRLESEPLPSVLDDWERQPVLAPRSGVSPLALELRRKRRLEHRGPELASALRCLGLACMPSYAESVSALGCPVTLMAGELDIKFRALGEVLAAEIPGAELVVVHGSGHDLPLEAPRVVAQTLLAGSA